MRWHNQDPPPQRPCVGWTLLFDRFSSFLIARPRKQGNTGIAQRLAGCPRGINHMPVYRTDRESLLLQGDIPGCIRRIALALLDPRQSRREIRREEQADEAYPMRGRKTFDFCPFRLLQIGGIKYDRTALGEDTLGSARKHAIDTLRDIGPIGGFRQS